jgi:hypothetical protein
MSQNFLKMPDKVFGIDSSLVGMFLLPVGMVIVFIVSLGLVILPRIDNIKQSAVSISETRSQIKSVAEKKAYLLSIDQDELAKNEEQLSAAVLPEKNSYVLVGVLRTIADKYGYQVNSFSINPVGIKGDAKDSLTVSDKNVATKLPINIVLTGPEEKNLDLIKSIENSLPILFIDSMRTTSKLGVLEIEMVISSYYVPDKVEYVSGNLSLVDLQPTKEEADLLARISNFESNSNLEETSIEGKTFTEYSRDNPFTL